VPSSFPPAEIPAEETVISEGAQLIASTSGWQKGKTYFGSVQTYYQAKGAGDGALWHCRVSEHDVNFDEFWQKLAVNKPVHEKK